MSRDSAVDMTRQPQNSQWPLRSMNNERDSSTDPTSFDVYTIEIAIKGEFILAQMIAHDITLTDVYCKSVCR